MWRWSDFQRLENHPILMGVAVWKWDLNTGTKPKKNQFYKKNECDIYKHGSYTDYEKGNFTVATTYNVVNKQLTIALKLGDADEHWGKKTSNKKDNFF